MADTQRRRKDRASRALAEGRLRDALERYREVVRQDPNELNARMKIGDIHRRLSDTAAAIDAYEWVAEAYAQDGLLLKAMAVCKVILSLDPRHTSTQSMLAELYAKRRSPASGTEAPVAPSRFGEKPPEAVLPTPEPRSVGLTEPPPRIPPTNGAPRPEPRAESAAPSASTGDVDRGPEIVIEEPAEASDPVAAPPARPLAERIPEAQTWADAVQVEEVDPIQIAAAAKRAKAAAGGAEPVADASGGANPFADAAGGAEPVGGADAFGGPDAAGGFDPFAGPDAAGGSDPFAGPDAAGGSDPFAGTNSAAADGTDFEITLEDEPMLEPPAADAASPMRPEARPVPPRPQPTSAAGTPGLPEIPLFSDLPKAAFIELLVNLKHRAVRAGQVVIREGDPGDSFFVVAEGQVEVARFNDQGQQVRLARLSDGAFFGEMALLQSGPRTATVTAVTDAQILEISRDAVEKVITQYPSVATALRNFHRQRLLATTMATNELFRPFPPEVRRELMEQFKAKTFERGEVLLEEDAPATGLYILLHGRLVVTKGRDDEEVQLAELNPGEMFGEMSLLSNTPTTARVTAVTDCFVIRLSKRKFQEVMMTHPHVLEVVAKISEERKQDNERLLGPRLSHHAAILV